MKVQAIIPAAGVGTRLKTKQTKSLILLKGKPLFVYSIEAMEKCPAVANVIVVAGKKYLKVFAGLVKKFKLKKVKRIVAGGRTRCESVRKGLAALDEDTEAVVIHDGARPLIKPGLIVQAIKALEKDPAVVIGVPVKPTIKKVDLDHFYIRETLQRETLWEVQTPQVFKKEILLKAHALMLESNPTDDAVLVEKMGVKVKMVMGDYQNIKITTQEDLAIARIFLSYEKGENRWYQNKKESRSK